MQGQEWRMYILNIITLLLSFSNKVENTLKIVLLIVSIIYTCMKIADYIKTKRIKE
jgi:hypothetical protein